MEKIIFSFLRVMLSIIFLVIFISYVIFIDKYPWLGWMGIFIVCIWFFSRSGFGYPVRWESISRDWLVGHKLKYHWVVLLVICTLFCFPVGLVIREIYFCFSVKKDGTFSKKFYFFFEKEAVTL